MQSGDNLTFGAIAMTMMACQDDLSLIGENGPVAVFKAP